MRKLLALLLLSPLAFAEKNEMVPLSEYVKTLGSNSTNLQMLYFTNRCSGLFLTMNELTEEAEQEGVTDTFQKLATANMQLYIVHLAHIKTAKLDYAENFARSVRPIIENYAKEAFNSSTNTGRYFNDYIIEDAEMCIKIGEAYSKESG